MDRDSANPSHAVRWRTYADQNPRTTHRWIQHAARSALPAMCGKMASFASIQPSMRKSTGTSLQAGASCWQAFTQMCHPAAWMSTPEAGTLLSQGANLKTVPCASRLLSLCSNKAAADHSPKASCISQ